MVNVIFNEPQTVPIMEQFAFRKDLVYFLENGLRL